LTWPESTSATGTGEQTLLAAQRVGPTGAVLATDIAARMLALAEEAVARAGLGNVETRVLDARDLNLEPGSFDAAIARLALMLVPERARVMAGIHQALRPGKKFAALVIGTADECPLIALPMGIAGRHAGAPQAPFGDPGLFALGDPVVLEAVYRDAGFRDVTVEAAPVQRRFPSLAVAMQNVRDLLPEIPQLLMQATETEREAAWAEIEDALRQYDNADEIVALRSNNQHERLVREKIRSERINAILNVSSVRHLLNQMNLWRYIHYVPNPNFDPLNIRT